MPRSSPNVAKAVGYGSCALGAAISVFPLFIDPVKAPPWTITGVTLTIIGLLIIYVAEHYIATDAQDSINLLTLSTDEARKATEHERSERLKLEARLAPRIISLDNQQHLSDSMKKWNFAGSAHKQQCAVFPYPHTNSEAADLADTIGDCLEEAGWEVNRREVKFGALPTLSGVGLLNSSQSRGQLVARDLCKTLNEMDISCHVLPFTWDEHTKNSFSEEYVEAEPFYSYISIFVGDKPL